MLTLIYQRVTRVQVSADVKNVMVAISVNVTPWKNDT